MKRSLVIIALLFGLVSISDAGDTLSSINAQVVGLSFFEEGLEETPLGQIVYSSTFEKDTARYIMFKLDLDFSPPGRIVEFPIVVRYIYPDGSQKGEFDSVMTIQPDWPGLWKISGWGNKNPGISWKTLGKYTVEIYDASQKIATGNFTITDGCQGLSYYSDSTYIQWGCRNYDTFYCIDVFDSNWNMVKQAAVCGENTHVLVPSTLNLPADNYRWKVWSSSGYGGDGFEGSFSIQGDCPPYKSDLNSVQWGCRYSDTFYCIDIYDSNWNMFQQAVACGEKLHSFSPASLNLPPNNYNWKVWSSSGYGGDGFEGSFSLIGCSGLSYQSDSKFLQWGCRGGDTFYCVDIYDNNGDMLNQAVRCGENVHSFSPLFIDLPNGNYYWKVWSSTGYGGNGFEGMFQVNNNSSGGEGGDSGGD